jgi:hypothetical protein
VVQMNQQQFDEAVEKLQIEGLGGVGSECTARVFFAACFVMSHRLNLPDGKEWSGPTSDDLSDFLFDISDKQRKRLKRIADALIERGETFH